MKAEGGFEIYFDPVDDPDIGEILVFRKRPSWVERGLGGDEKEEGKKERWRTIGRGRRDSKEEKKGKENYKTSSSL